MKCCSKYTKFKKQKIPVNEEVSRSVPKVDSNLFELDLSCLISVPILSTGDPYKCASCNSILNSASSVTPLESQKQWICDFCSHVNIISIEDEEIPKILEQNYLLEGPALTLSDQTTPVSYSDTTSTVFCIDISGSMAFSKKIQGNICLINKKTESKDGFTSVTRLECVQAAVESQLRQMQTQYPMKKAGIVVFNSTVQILGDGVESEKIDRAVCNNFADLMNYSQSQRGRFLNTSIESSYPILSQKLMGLSPTGGTALGPALLFSIILASESGPGSKVVICTDGEANEGIGSLSGKEEDYDIYKELGSISKELGVSVSVITIEGQECKLEALNFVTSETQGEIVKVAPESLLTEFSNILSDEVVATEVSLEIYLHKSVKFYNEKEEFLFNNGSILKRFIGNATKTTAFSFQYILKTEQELAELGIIKQELRRIPLQTIVVFRKMDGRKFLKVLNKVQEVVFDEEVKDESLDTEVLFRAGRREAARLLEEGKLEEANLRGQAWQVMVREELKVEGNEGFMNDMNIVQQAAGRNIVKGNNRLDDQAVIELNRFKKGK